MSPTHFHPMLVHFPIALALAAFLFHLVSYFVKQEWLNKASVALTVLATLGAVAAILSGYLFTKPVAGLAATMKEVHVTYALASTVLLIMASVAGLMMKGGEEKKWQYIYAIFLTLCAVGISLTGLEGGSIVYDVWLFS